MSEQHKQPLSVVLNNGAKMPLMGLGTLMYTLKPDDEAVVRMVESALDIGYRHFDTAQVYNTEKAVGEALKRKSSLINRKDVFITTKLWRTDTRRERVVPSLKKSLERMNLDYIDLFLIHWPTAFQAGDVPFPRDDKGKLLIEDTDYLETWKGMEECVDLGLAKAIGVSNFNSKQLQRLLDHCRIKPANCQLEVHPFLTNRKLIEFCQDKGITVAAYAPLAGFAPKKREEKGWPTIYTDQTIGGIAEKHQRTPAQVVLRFLLQRQLAVLPKSENPDRIRENFEALDFELTADEVKEIYNCDRGMRLCDDDCLDHRHYPFNEEF